jgi:hypothetical protein
VSTLPFILAFSGYAPRSGDDPSLLETAYERVRGVLDAYDGPTPSEVRTGGAFGVDSAAAVLAKARWPLARHVLVAPAAPYNTALRGDVEFDLVLRASAGATVAASYLNRNDFLLGTDALADLLLAFPRLAVEQWRSGTWATIRRARKRGVAVAIHPLTPANA